MTTMTLEQIRDDIELHIQNQSVTWLESARHWSVAITAHLAAVAKAVPKGVASYMPGTDGFTMACFKATDVPVGSAIYTNPQPAAQKVVVDFDQIGSAGPFHIINGRIGLPAETMQDMFRMAFGYTAAQDAVSVSDEDVERAMEGWGAYWGDANDANVAGNNRDAVRAALESFARGKAAQPSDGMIEVTQEDGNNYCSILRALGMEEEGDPVAEVKRLVAQPSVPVERGWLPIKTADKDCGAILVWNECDAMAEIAVWAPGMNCWLIDNERYSDEGDLTYWIPLPQPPETYKLIAEHDSKEGV